MARTDAVGEAPNGRIRLQERDATEGMDAGRLGAVDGCRQTIHLLDLNVNHSVPEFRPVHGALHTVKSNVLNAARQDVERPYMVGWGEGNGYETRFRFGGKHKRVRFGRDRIEYRVTYFEHQRLGVSRRATEQRTFHVGAGHSGFEQKSGSRADLWRLRPVTRRNAHVAKSNDRRTSRASDLGARAKERYRIPAGYHCARRIIARR